MCPNLSVALPLIDLMVHIPIRTIVQKQIGGKNIIETSAKVIGIEVY